MTGINHAVGGVVFTGVFASFFNVNVFSSVGYLALTLLASLLPDIDHTRSLIGKMFYPVAKYLDRHYRHRTITHSLVFMVGVCLIVAFTERIFIAHHHYSLILFFGLLSHFIFDMVTIQGIPLFYPFYRNPCVIFGNPSFRLKTNNRQSELVVLAIFILIGISCTNLFKNGFWTSYNRSFGTLKHLHQENKSTDKVLNVEYKYQRNGQTFEGIAVLIESTNNSAVLLSNPLKSGSNTGNTSNTQRQIIYLDKDNQQLSISHVKPIPTDQQKIIHEHGFYNITLDSLRNLLANKVVSGNIQSSVPVQIFENNIRKVTNVIKLEYSYNAELSIAADTAKENLRNQLTLKLERLEQKRQRRRQEIEALEAVKTKRSQRASSVQKETDSYRKNQLKNEIISLDQKIEQQAQSLSNYVEDHVLLKEIELLQKEFKDDNVLFSGLVEFGIYL